MVFNFFAANIYIFLNISNRNSIRNNNHTSNPYICTSVPKLSISANNSS